VIAKRRNLVFSALLSALFAWPANAADDQWSLLSSYCTDCHNATDWAGSVAFDTMTPDAFIVFNGYGDLSGYGPARIMAHMAGMTYRKVAFTCTPMYVNGEQGYLVAPEALAEKYTDGRLSLTVPQHADLYDTEINASKELTNA